MNCQDVRRLLHPYSDGELDLVRHVEIEQHLAGCADCAEQENQVRALRTALSSPSLYYRAPASLRTRVELALPPAPRRGRTAMRWVAAAAGGILVLIGASAAIGLLSSQGASADDRLAERVVEGHVRSLQVDHLTDVLSSNRHVVKPWFLGKLDFAPRVSDLAPEGYVLSGGRLDYLADRPVAALVYKRRLHSINLFTWPGATDEEKAVRGMSRQGFNLRSWRQSGMNYWVISDLNGEELDDFVRLVRELPVQTQP